jgi:hypothetical protein
MIARSLSLTWILIQRVTADDGLSCQFGFYLNCCRPSLKLRNRRRTKRLFAAGGDAALFGQGNALALPLTDQRPLELSKGAHHGAEQHGHRRVIAGKG